MQWEKKCKLNVMPLTSSWKQILELEETCHGVHNDIWIMIWMLYLLLSDTTVKCFQGVKQQTWDSWEKFDGKNLSRKVKSSGYYVMILLTCVWREVKYAFNKGSISKLTSQKGLWNLNIHVNKTIIPPLTLNKSRTCKVSHYIRFFSQLNKNIILFNSIIPYLGPMRWRWRYNVQLNTKSEVSVKNGIRSPR